MVEFEYAKALYDLAKEENKTELFSNSLSAVCETIRNKEFYDVITSPTIDKISKKNVIRNVYKSLDETFVNFLCVVVDHNRFSKMQGIKDQFNSLVLLEKNIVKVEIISANELTSSQLAEIEKTLELRFEGKKLDINNIVNQDLLGGIQILCNGEALDMSLKGFLDNLRVSL